MLVLVVTLATSGINQNASSRAPLWGIFLSGPFAEKRPALNLECLIAGDLYSMWVLLSGSSLHKRTRNLLIFVCLLSLFHCWGIPLLVWNVIFRIPVKCCGPRIQVHPSRHKRLLKARLNAGQHKEGGKGGLINQFCRTDSHAELRPQMSLETNF